MCFSIDQCIASGIHIFTFANSSRNIPLNISFFIHFLYTFCVRFKAKATAGFDIRGLKCPEFLAMTTPKKVQTVVKKHPKAFRTTRISQSLLKLDTADLDVELPDASYDPRKLHCQSSSPAFSTDSPSTA